MAEKTQTGIGSNQGQNEYKDYEYKDFFKAGTSGVFKCTKEVYRNPDPYSNTIAAIYYSYYGRYDWETGYAVIIRKEGEKNKLTYWKANKWSGGIYEIHHTYDVKTISNVKDLIANVNNTEDCEKVIKYVSNYFNENKDDW